jgi:hypothetical protein
MKKFKIFLFVTYFSLILFLMKFKVNIKKLVVWRSTM